MLIPLILPVPNKQSSNREFPPVPNITYVLSPNNQSDEEFFRTYRSRLNLPEVRVLPLGIRLNNPGAMRPSKAKWQGATGVALIGKGSGYVQFASPVWGLRALSRTLRTKHGRGLDTVEKIISEYAPKKADNNKTEAYIFFVSKRLGVTPDQKIDLRNDALREKMVRAIVCVENGVPPNGTPGDWYSDDLYKKAMVLEETT